MFCKYCGKRLSDRAIFCSACGKRLVSCEESYEDFYNDAVESVQNQKNLKYCKFCGEQIVDVAKFCPKCGKNIIPKENQTVEAPKDFTTQKGEKIETNQKLDRPKDVITVGKKENMLLSSISAQSADLPTTQHEAILKTESHINKESVIYNEQVKIEQLRFKKDLIIENEKFSVKNIFVQVFKRHTSQECNEILKAGLSDGKSGNDSLKKLEPWLYSRVFIILFLVFIIFEICLLSFHNSNIMPGLMLIGSIMIPFSMLTFYFELNIYRDISFFRTIGIFLLGGAVSLLFTLFLYQIIPTTDEFNLLGASLVSIIEEIGKVVITIIIIKRKGNVTVLHGLLIGGAIGCGFAVFESAGYAFNVYLTAHDYNTRVDIVNDYLPLYYQYGYADSIGEMNFNIFLRSILSFGGHTAWAAIEGASFAKENKMSAGFIKAFAICFGLHALWDTNTTAIYFKLGILCIAAWYVIIRQIANFVEDKKSR